MFAAALALGTLRASTNIKSLTPLIKSYIKNTYHTKQTAILFLSIISQRALFTITNLKLKFLGLFFVLNLVSYINPFQDSPGPIGMEHVISEPRNKKFYKGIIKKDHFMGIFL